MTARHGKGLDDAAPRAQMTLEFKKNALLPALAGSHGRHLVRLEHKLGVKIGTRGKIGRAHV